jgi:ribonuclease T2
MSELTIRGLLASALAVLAASLVAADAAGAPANLLATSDFDFYVLTLSWSPGFCDTGGAGKSPEQCAAGAGQGFVVHGLWPENSNRPYPEDCGETGHISSTALAETHGVYPNEGLARYEYIKHGLCTGLTPENYFAAVKYARDQFVVPDALKAPHEKILTSPDRLQSDFIAVNPNLTADNMAVTCSGGELVDVRFCVSKDLGAFVVCPKVAGHTCRSPSISVAPLR